MIGRVLRTGLSSLRDRAAILRWRLAAIALQSLAQTHYPEADREVARARLRFKGGDRVRHIDRGWVGTVTDEPSDSATAWCLFDGIGQAGADPRKLRHL